MKTDILSLTESQLKSKITELGEKPYRAAQVFAWLHRNHALDFGEMTSLPKGLRDRLGEVFCIRPVKIIKKIESLLDSTKKYLFETDNSNIIEGVLMKYESGNSVCVSSQAGCRMGCRFCASGLNGLERNLSAGEMLSQVYTIAGDIGESVSNVVIMGCGEPLDNYGELVRFLEIINSPGGLNMSHRRITVSTCGLADKIRELVGLRLQITLAVSLHAPNDGIRRRIMPAAAKYPLKELLAACGEYAEKTGRRVTYEYAMIAGLNDDMAHARELAGLLEGSLCHVNLIPVNNVLERGFVKSGAEAIDRFAEILAGKGITVTKRREMGADIDAACGQLRNRLTVNRE